VTPEERKAETNRKRAESMRRAWAECKGTLGTKNRQRAMLCKCGCGNLAKIGNVYADGCYNPGLAHKGRKHSAQWKRNQSLGLARAHKKGAFVGAAKKRKEATLAKRPKCKCGCGRPVSRSGALYASKLCVPHYGRPAARMDEIRGLRDMKSLCEANRIRLSEQINEWKNSGKLEEIRRKAKNAKGMLDHLAAKVWVVRDPYGNIYRFSNLSEWARNNQHLFVDEFPDANLPFWRRIAGGFVDLLKKNGRSCSYKGWTAVSKLELESGGLDLLGRDYFSQQTSEVAA
jgi:hypothetical protein